MVTVSLLIEILRTQPRLMFWLAALTQAVLWLLVPALFYSAPPGDVANVLAIGHDMSFGSTLGHPLAYWLADIALQITGGHMVGVYLLSQICIVVTYWAVFELGRAIVGDRHAVLAVLLMAGISVFTVASPDFGPDILMMPLWALALLFLWRAAGEAKQLYWIALAATFILMLLTSPLALLLLPLVVLFLLITERGRLVVSNVHALAAAIIVFVAMLVLFFLMRRSGVSLTANLPHLRNAASFDQNIVAWLRLLGLVVLAHAGAAILIALASNLPRTRQTDAAAITGHPVDPFARLMIYTFALAPLLVVMVVAAIAGKSTLSSVAPLLVLTGLAVIVAAGDTIMVHHQRILGVAWFSLLLVPPVLTAVGVLLLPAVFAADLKVAQPADDIAQYFTDSFERRTGQKLEVVGGDPRLATIVALASSSRPRVLNERTTDRPPLATLKDAEDKGAVIIWRATDNAGTPPANIRAQFPNIVPEVPRAFERAIQGRAPVLRIGWGMIRPKADTPTATPAPQ